MSTYVSVVIIDNKANVVVSPSLEIHSRSVAELKLIGGNEISHDIINHELNDVIVGKE